MSVKDLQKFNDVLLDLPIELQLKIGYQLYYFIDIEKMIRTGVPKDFKMNPVIPYMEIDFPYVKFKPVNLHGGIALDPSVFNDFKAEGGHLISLKNELDSLFHANTKVNKLVIFFKGSPTMFDLDKYVAAAKSVIVFNPPYEVNTYSWWSKVNQVKFNRKYILPTANHHTNLSVVDYMKIKFSGVQSMCTFIHRAVVSTSIFAQSTELKFPLILKFRIIDGKELSQFKEAFLEIQKLAESLETFKIFVIFKVKESSSHIRFLQTFLSEKRIKLCK